jgi:hypothetical protein
MYSPNSNVENWMSFHDELTWKREKMQLLQGKGQIIPTTPWPTIGLLSSKYITI